MRFYTQQHKHYCGIDLHARSLYLCILDQVGKVLVHRKLACDRAELIKTLRPYRKDLAVAVECLFCWYWVADLCEEQGFAFVLGHALYMKAIHGGKAKNDRLDSYKIAALLRGGNLPFAYVYPRQMRPTRDLLRRRLFFARKRGELLAHIQNTNTQYNLPPLEQRPDKTKDRGAIIEHFENNTLQMTVAVDVTLLDSYDQGSATSSPLYTIVLPARLETFVEFIPHYLVVHRSTNPTYELFNFPFTQKDSFPSFNVIMRRLSPRYTFDTGLLVHVHLQCIDLACI